jgi:hypothetical protein
VTEINLNGCRLGNPLGPSFAPIMTLTHES